MSLDYHSNHKRKNICITGQTFRNVIIQGEHLGSQSQVFQMLQGSYLTIALGVSP